MSERTEAESSPECACGCHRNRTCFLLVIVGLALAASTLWRGQVRAPARAPAAVAAGVAAPAAPDATVAVYYFHGGIRCEKCLEIERVSRETVLSFYAEDLAAGRMSWQSVDYMLPENLHFMDEFNLKHPSLAVETRQRGAPVARLVLSNTWDKVEAQEDLEAYVVKGIEGFRNGQEGEAVGAARLR